MANTRIIKRRIKSAKNIGQITKAMQMVSAAKMKKAQHQLLASRPYNNEVFQIFSSLCREVNPVVLEQYMGKSKDRNILIIIIGPSKGLAGALVSNLARYTIEYINTLKKENDGKEINIKLVTVEKKSLDFASKLQNERIAHFARTSSSLFETVIPIAELALEELKERRINEIHFIYSKYISSFIQKADGFKLIPLDRIELRSNRKFNGDYLFEPDVDNIFEEFFPLYIKSQIYQCLLESNTAEQAARMVAMQNATDNAKSLSQQLQLEYNQKRQANVTQEILEIVSAQL